MSEPPSSSTRYQEIASHLRDELLAGRYGEEGRMPSEAQLGRRFGVSRPTAARALRALVDEGLIERRAGSGTFAKSKTSRSPMGTAEGLFALMIPDLGNTEVFALLCGEIASLTRAHNYSLLWGGSHQPKLDSEMSVRHVEELCQHFIERRVSGVFFAPYELVKEKEEFNIRATNLLREAGIPLVLLDRDLVSFPGRTDFDLVSVDNVTGGYLAAQHLLKLGCRRVHFVTPPYSAPSVDARIAGVREALGTLGGEMERGWIHVGDLSEKKFIRGLVTPNRPDAIICANDHTAMLLLRELRRISIRVPEDIRVVGFDGVMLSNLISPPLTTIQQPCRQLALAAVRAMLDRQEDPALPARHITVLPRLVVRESCGTYHNVKN